MTINFLKSLVMIIHDQWYFFQGEKLRNSIDDFKIDIQDFIIKVRNKSEQLKNVN